MTNIIHILLCVILCLAGCAHHAPVSIFPPGVDPAYYAKHYAVMQETPIWPLAQSEPPHEVYRYLSLPSWGDPELIRIDVLPDGNTLTTFKKSSRDGNDAGILTASRTVQASRSEFALFTNLLYQSEFWSMPSESPHPPAFDGVTGIMEVLRGRRYHVVDWSPPACDDYTLAIMQLWQLVFPEEPVPPVHLIRKDHVGPLAPADSDQVLRMAQQKRLETEGQVRSAFGAPHAERRDPRGKNVHYMLADHGILSLRYDEQGKVIVSRLTPDQGYGQQTESTVPSKAAPSASSDAR